MTWPWPRSKTGSTSPPFSSYQLLFDNPPRLDPKSMPPGRRIAISLVEAVSLP